MIKLKTALIEKEDSTKNFWLKKLKKDIEQSLYNFKKTGLDKAAPSLVKELKKIVSILKDDFDM